MGFALLALVVPAAPTVVNLGEARRAFAPEGHARWLGDRYLVSDLDGVRIPGDATGVPSVVGTLAAWSGRVAPDPAGTDRGLESGAGMPSVEAELAFVLGGLGFHGAWVRPGPPGLDGLRVPFVAIVGAEAAAVPVLVRRLISGYVYAFDPRVGTVLYRPEDWSRAWSGRAFVFDERPPSPGPWR